MEIDIKRAKFKSNLYVVWLWNFETILKFDQQTCLKSK